MANDKWNLEGAKVDQENKLTVETLNISSIPTSASGLVSGDIWSNSGVLTVVA
jgi:hypothetical protein